ncbi:MAG: ABC transporter substrate-binding protein [Candidatus Protistobacter heckmanni]|nr:ABC transporter substrate-binding protein [Candidatus Protistobacter heckmanni]
MMFALAAPACASEAAQIALPVSLSGAGEFGSRPVLTAVRIAVEEANEDGGSPAIELTVLDDQSKTETAKRLAEQISKSSALVTLGPTSSNPVLAVVADYAHHGVPAILSTTHADDVTRERTIFRTVINISQLGEAIANHSFHILGQRRAVLIVKKGAYGDAFAEGFQRVANRVGIETGVFGFTGNEDRKQTVIAASQTALAAAKMEHRLATRTSRTDPPVVLGMTYEDAVPVVIDVKRQGVRGPIMGPANMARSSFASLFANEPDEKARPGYFTEGAYVATPVLLDRANALALEFAQRYQDRHRKPASWEAILGYEAAMLAIAKIRKLWAAPEFQRAGVATRRAALLQSPAQLDSRDHTERGLAGPLWLKPDRNHPQLARIGVYLSGVLQSAPM